MKTQKLIKLLQSRNFSEIKNNWSGFEGGYVIFSKPIEGNIYLLFIIWEDHSKALIAKFYDQRFIGRKEPAEVMFSMSVKDKKDVDYLEKFLQVPIG